MKTKTKLLITSLSLMAASAYAQSSIPSVGMPPPTVRAEMPGQGAPSMPQPAMQRPTPQMNQNGPQPAVGATGSTGADVRDPGTIKYGPHIIIPVPTPHLFPASATTSNSSSGGDGGVPVTYSTPASLILPPPPGPPRPFDPTQQSSATTSNSSSGDSSASMPVFRSIPSGGN